VRRVVPTRLSPHLRRVRTRWVRSPRPSPTDSPTADPQALGFRFDPASRVHLLVGPANFAGQGWAWGRAAERLLDGVSTQVFAFEKGAYDFEVDVRVPVAVYRSRPWQLQQEALVRDEVTHLLIEALRPITGTLHGGDCSGEVPLFRSMGKQVALVCHGSEVRNPSRHAREYPYSPFGDPDDDLVAALQRQADRLGAIANSFDGPVFVSTPDLLDDVHQGIWLPLVIDVPRWRTEAPVLERERPVLLAAPTHSRLKGVEALESVLDELDASGLVEVRRLPRMEPHEMPAHIADADIVLDQFLVGSYGVMAVQGMAAGRVVLGHIDGRVRARIDRDVPLVESTVSTFRQTVDEVLADRPRFQAVAAAGVGFAQEVHDGRRAASVLSTFLGRPLRTTAAPAQAAVDDAIL